MFFLNEHIWNIIYAIIKFNINPSVDKTGYFLDSSS